MVTPTYETIVNTLVLVVEKTNMTGPLVLTVKPPNCYEKTMPHKLKPLAPRAENSNRNSFHQSIRNYAAINIPKQNIWIMSSFLSLKLL